jgi:hypothetical protein
VSNLCARFLPAQMQLEKTLIKVLRVQPNNMASFRLPQPSRMVMFISHSGLQGILFGTSPSWPEAQWVSNYAMADVLDRMIQCRPDFPPVEVAISRAVI